jgi:hypothetical protein
MSPDSGSHDYWIERMTNSIPQTPVSVSPGVAGAFGWRGLNWTKRSGPPNSRPSIAAWSTSNVVTNTDGTVTLRLTNNTGSAPEGSAMTTTRRGFGHGTYYLVVEGPMVGMGKSVVFGGLFTYENSTVSPAASHNEIDMCEASAWGMDRTPTYKKQHWRTGPATDPISVPAAGGHFPVKNTVMTHRTIWEASKIAYDTWDGYGTNGTPLNHAESTEYIPVPASEKLVINLWVHQNGPSPCTSPPIDITLRDLAFIPKDAPVVQR